MSTEVGTIYECALCGDTVLSHVPNYTFKAKPHERYLAYVLRHRHEGCDTYSNCKRERTLHFCHDCWAFVKDAAICDREE